MQHNRTTSYTLVFGLKYLPLIEGKCILLSFDGLNGIHYYNDFFNCSYQINVWNIVLPSDFNLLSKSFKLSNTPNTRLATYKRNRKMNVMLQAKSVQCRLCFLGWLKNSKIFHPFYYIMPLI